jgi:plasmid stabilization system protein ParE
MKIKPNISKDFNIDDIHKIREWHYELRKEMGMAEYARKLSEKLKNILADFPAAKIVSLS